MIQMSIYARNLNFFIFIRIVIKTYRIAPVNLQEWNLSRSDNVDKLTSGHVIIASQLPDIFYIIIH